MIIHDGDEKNRNKWKLAIVAELIKGRHGPHGTVRAVRPRTSKGQLERPVQHLYSLELACNKAQPESLLNPAVADFQARSKRTAAAVAEITNARHGGRRR